MFLPESVKSTLEQNAQNRSNVPLYTFRINVPNINDCTSYLRGCQDPKPSGCSSFLGLERSGEECAAAVGDIVYLLLERHRAGTGQAQGLPLRVRGGRRGSRRGMGGLGQAQGLPLPGRGGRRGSRRGMGGLGQAQGLPLPGRGGRRGSRRGMGEGWAGTRPAPTGPGRWKGESTRGRGG